MKSFGILLFACASLTAATDTYKHWPTPLQIERLSIAVALADYPIPEGKFQTVVGQPEYCPLVLGGGPNRMTSDAEFVVLALSDPDAASGFFGLRIHFARQSAAPAAIPGRDIVSDVVERQVSGSEVVFWSSSPRVQMVIDPDSDWRKAIGSLRQTMKEKGLSPRELSEVVCPPTAISAQLPNHSTEPTPPAGTSAAEHPPLQP